MSSPCRVKGRSPLWGTGRSPVLLKTDKIFFSLFLCYFLFLSFFIKEREKKKKVTKKKREKENFNINFNMRNFRNFLYIVKKTKK